MRAREATDARLVALIALGALALHQLRYALAHGPEAGAALAREGHAYLQLVAGPVLTLALAAIVVSVVRRAWSGGPRSAPSAPRMPLDVLVQLTHEDFGPDERSPHGYISRVQTKGRIRDPQFVEGSLHFGLVRADGTSGGHEIEYTFSADTRKQWYARDELDNISANLWDIFAARVSAAEDSGVIEVPFKEPTFLVFSGVKFRIQRMSFEVVVRIHEFVIDVDMLKRGLAYENVVTGAVRIVPLPQLQGWQQPSTEEVSN